MDFYEKCKNAIETFNVLVIRVHDIYANRILNVLASMHDVALQTMPTGDEVWTIDEFLEKNEESCRLVEVINFIRYYSFKPQKLIELDWQPLN